jgi:hypothetical protein
VMIVGDSTDGAIMNTRVRYGQCRLSQKVIQYDTMMDLFLRQLPVKVLCVCIL